RRIVGMSMHDPADIIHVGVQVQVMREIDTRVERVAGLTRADLAALQIRGHQLSWREFFVIYATWLDEYTTRFAVNAAGVATVHRDESCAINAQIGFEDFFAQPFQSVHKSAKKFSGAWQSKGSVTERFR